jgi:hypothetical protein
MMMMTKMMEDEEKEKGKWTFWILHNKELHK